IEDEQIIKYIHEYNEITSNELQLDMVKSRVLKQTKLIEKIDHMNYVKIFKNANRRVQNIMNNSRYYNTANQWIYTPPNNITGKLFNKLKMRIILKQRFRLPLSVIQYQKCQKCIRNNKNTEIDLFGDHAIICEHANHRIRRHDDIVRELYKLSLEAGLDTSMEPTRLIK